MMINTDATIAPVAPPPVSQAATNATQEPAGRIASVLSGSLGSAAPSQADVGAHKIPVASAAVDMNQRLPWGAVKPAINTSEATAMPVPKPEAGQDPLLQAIRRAVIEDLELLPKERWTEFVEAPIFAIWREEAPDMLLLPEVLRTLVASLPEHTLRPEDGVSLPKSVAVKDMVRVLRRYPGDFRLPGEEGYDASVPLMLLPEHLPFALSDLLRQTTLLLTSMPDEEAPVPAIWRVVAESPADQMLRAVDHSVSGDRRST